MNIDQKIARKCWNSQGCKKGQTASTRYARRVNKRGAKAAALRWEIAA